VIIEGYLEVAERSVEKDGSLTWKRIIKKKKKIPHINNNNIF
jgi:hypothetical protein